MSEPADAASPASPAIVPAADAGAAPPDRAGGAAAVIGASILASRILGLVRQRVFAHYFGVQSDAADAFNAAFRIPNFLQNLFGEGVLSASFIPVYARLVAEGDEEEAGRLAGAVFAVLALLVAAIVLVCVLATPLLVDVIAAGFVGEKRELTIRLVRVLFPGAGLLVLSAWCLGILNSHHRFLVSYMAPVLWNFAMIGTLLVAGPRSTEAGLAVALAWGSVAGSALQFAVQLPGVRRLVRRLRVRLDTGGARVRQVIANFGPVFVGRGVVQISGFVDTMIASGLPTGAITGITFAQTLYMLPVSLFGMSVSAAELPAMARLRGSEQEVAAALRQRLVAGARRVAFFVIPSAVAFIALGDVLAALLFESGKFERGAAVYVWGILAGSAVGLLAATLGRLYSSTFYALNDTRTPLRFAIVRVAVGVALGAAGAFLLPPALGLDRAWGAAGLTLGSALAGWLEYALLRRALHARVGVATMGTGYALRLWAAALVAAAAGWGVRLAVGERSGVLVEVAILTAFGIAYLAMASVLVAESRAFVGGLSRRLGLSRRR